MASYMNVFVDGDVTLDDLVATLKGILSIVRVTYNSYRDAIYELYEEHTLVLVSENPFTNTDEINFEDFHYDIDVRGLNFHDSATALAQSHKRAEEIYAHLQAMGKYRLMLTNDVQIKEEEFIPVQYQQPPSEYALKAQQLPADIRVYAQMSTAITDFVEELARLLHTPVRKRRGSEDRTWYRLTDEKAYFDIVQTETAGSYLIDVVGRVFISGERRYWQFQSAHSLYEQLKATGKYALQLKGNDDSLFEEFSPAREAQ